MHQPEAHRPKGRSRRHEVGQPLGSELTLDLRVAVQSGGDDCVVIGFDTRQGQDTKLTQVSGVVPGVGKVFFRTEKETISGSSHRDVLEGGEPVAALSDGSFVTSRRRFTRGRFDMGLPDRLASVSRSIKDYEVPDPGGAGLWLCDFSGDGGFHVELMATCAAACATRFHFSANHPMAESARFPRAATIGSCGAAARGCCTPTHSFTFDPVAMTPTEDGTDDWLGSGIDYRGIGLFAKHKLRMQPVHHRVLGGTASRLRTASRSPVRRMSGCCRLPGRRGQAPQSSACRPCLRRH